MDSNLQENTRDVFRRKKTKNETSVNISTNKISEKCLWTAKMPSQSSTAQSIIQRKKKPTMLLFGGDGTPCFAKKTSSVNGKKRLSRFSEKFFRKSQSSMNELEPKEGQRNFSFFRWTSSELGFHGLSNRSCFSFFSSFQTLFAASQSVWWSQTSAKASGWLSISIQIYLSVMWTIWSNN